MPVRPRPTEGSEGADGGGSFSGSDDGPPSKKLAAAVAAAVAQPPLPPPSLPAAIAAAAAAAAADQNDDEDYGNPVPVPLAAPMLIDPPLPPAIGSDSGDPAEAAAPAAEAAAVANASPLDRPHASNPPKQPTVRTIVVAGMSPASFKDELLRIWPKRPNRKVRMVWINKHDAPPPLPEGWAWHEEHRCGAEALWEEVARAQGGGFERWEGQQLFVIMGAGTSVQDFTQLKVANGASYPFDKELLQASVEVDVVDPERIVVLSDSSSSSSDEGDSEEDEDDDGDENLHPAKTEEEGAGEAGGKQQEPEQKGRKRKEKEERPPPAPLSPLRTPLQEPLCMQTLRFMASLRRAYLERRLPGFHRWLASQQHRLAGVLTFNIDSLEFLALDPALHGRVLQFHGNINQLTTVDALSQPYKSRPSLGPGGCPRVWYDPEALGRIAAACPDTSRLVDIVLEQASEVYLGSSSSSSSAQGDAGGKNGGGGGSDSSNNNLRPSRPRRQTSALLSDTGAMDEVCRKLGRGLPLAAGLSSGELAKINAYFRLRIRGMYLGNCVFTGEANDARLARAAQSYLRSFVHEAGVGAGKEGVFARLEREVAEINLARGVLPPAEEAALFAAAGAVGQSGGVKEGVVVEVVERRREEEEEEETVEVSVSGGGGGLVVASSVVTMTTTITTTTLTVEGPVALKEEQPSPLEGGVDVGTDLNPPDPPQLVDVAAALTSD